MWIWMRTCFLLMPSWFGKNGANARSSNIPPWVARDINSKCLTSPGYPNNYPDNSDTNQTLSVPAGQSIEITFQDFNVEAHPSCQWDYLEFFDGNGEVIGKKLCGDYLPQKFTIPTSIATVLFHSDTSERMKGFKLCYKSGNINNKCLTSPRYPDNYPDNSDTEQTISVQSGQSIEITFQDFNVESHPSCLWDYVEFSDGNGKVIGKKLCGDSLPQKFTIPISSASVVFHSDISQSRKGFKFCYKAGKMSTIPQCPLDQQLTQDCRCGSENCHAGESCAKFKKNDPRFASLSSMYIFGMFDKNCTTECTNRCRQRGTLCNDGYPKFCTCPDGTRDVDNPWMCQRYYTGLANCTCSDGKVIDKTPNGQNLMAREVWLLPARGH